MESVKRQRSSHLVTQSRDIERQSLPLYMAKYPVRDMNYSTCHPRPVLVD